jgi:predicted ATP-binding protein involved in virulence
VLENQIQQLQQGATFIEVDPKLKVPVKVVQDAVDEVLKPVQWKCLQFSQRDEALVLRHNEYGVIKADQLSDGIKNILAMVADIAYRCVLLNRHLGESAAKESTGIVMIDEVDMHLHPSWQQTVVGSLQAAFPKIQFVLTTHSPQVLSTVPAECIRILSDGEVHTAAKGSKGAESSRLLKRIFGVDSRPQADENTQLLQAYEKLVYADQWDTEEAKQKRRQLDEIFAGEEPKLTELDLYIENRTWELEIEKDQ